jgi:20S proteasome alpha/beta subunit
MAGRNSVAIAIDARFGLGFQTISTANSENDSFSGGTSSRIMLLPGSNTLMAWTGLYGDGISFAEEMNILLAQKMRRSSCMRFDTNTAASEKMSPRAISMFMSHLLYRRRSAPYYVEPVIVGLEHVSVPSQILDDTNAQSKEKLKIDSLQQLQLTAASQYNKQISQPSNKPLAAKSNCVTYKTIQRPYLCTTDMLGARSTSSTFVCSGVASRSLHGIAEALWRPNLDAEELVEVCGKAFVSALERDCLSGYGAVVYLIESHEVEDGDENISIKEYVLACRND